MQIGAVGSYFDLAQIVLYVFWGSFAALVYYLHRENKREGYPLLSDRGERVVVQGFPAVPSPKEFLLHDGSVRYAPREEAPSVFEGVPSGRFPGAPLDPLGDPMLSGMGPGAWANRPDEPDLAFDDGLPKIVPLRTAGDFFLAWEDADPRGMNVVGLDGVIAGTISDAWIDRSEVVVRYLEVALDVAFGMHHVLLPMNFTEFKNRRSEIHVNFITAAQFATVPVLKNPDVITFLEEEKISAYYGGGMLYATAARSLPIL